MIIMNTAAEFSTKNKKNKIIYKSVMALYNKYSLKKCHCFDELNNYLSFRLT